MIKRLYAAQQNVGTKMVGKAAAKSIYGNNLFFLQGAGFISSMGIYEYRKVRISQFPCKFDPHLMPHQHPHPRISHQSFNTQRRNLPETVVHSQRVAVPYDEDVSHGEEYVWAAIVGANSRLPLQFVIPGASV